MIFLVDHFFSPKKNSNAPALVSRIPVTGNDKIVFADVTYEPKTIYVDQLAR
jgi:3-deoxy-alpha-D-manno-octulosonate 8-oxidase